MHGLDGLEVVDKRFDELNMSFVPYMPDHTKFPLDTNEICFAHQTFVGADYGYYRPDIGVDADKIKSELIISGHLHRKQQFGKVFYPGSVISKGVEDVDQIKGIHTLDTETYEIKFIPSPFPKWVGRKYELSPELSLKDVHEDLQNLSDEDVTVVEISGPRAEIVAYTSSEAWKKLKEIKTIRLDTKFIDSEKRMISIKSNSVEGIFDEYVEKVYNGSVDKMRLKQKAAEFFKKKRAL
jgi:DNA repair exonuclease SbcCD nuclease subunit